MHSLRLFILCLVLIACKKPENPSIPRSEMIKILADIHLSEASIGNISPQIKDSIASMYLDQILKIHKTSKDNFNSSLRIYNQDPIEIEKIYEDVLKELEGKGLK